ncbi:MAG: aspartate aminotransferase family protein [Candidatus Omnitrophica bacterium]|nr:aspartate aminotransferase family protein [Candidatus Omnitrophota bacterium]
MPNAQEIINLANSYILNTYKRVPVVFVKGRGSYVWDQDGKKYLDFFPGWAVSGLGHCHKSVVSSVIRQLKEIIHVSNNYYSYPQAVLAQKLSASAFGGKVFFCNSGAEANEAAIKLARAYGSRDGRYKIITMEKSFHGRTMATLTATGQEKVKTGFYPLLEGFTHVPFNNIDAVRNAVDELTVAVMIEPIQGEGGINIAGQEYMKELRALCKAKDLLLILDEVQTGMGRTGKLFCYQHYGILPDIMTLAKSLGAGLPIAAMMASDRLVDVLKPGMHASTFGGSPVVCAASIAALEAINRDRLLANADRMGDYIVRGIQKLKKRFPAVISSVRHKGLMIGVELNIDGQKIIEQCFNMGLLINCTQSNILRIMPPITVRRSEAARALKILANVMVSL